MNNFLLTVFRSFVIFYLITHTVYGMEREEKSSAPSKKKKSSRQEPQITESGEISREEIALLSSTITSKIYNFSGINKKLNSISPTHQFTNEQIARTALFLSPSNNSLDPNANEDFQTIINILKTLKDEPGLGEKIKNVLAGYECYTSFLWLKDPQYLVTAVDIYHNGLAELLVLSHEETGLIYQNAIKENKNKKPHQQEALRQGKQEAALKRALERENRIKEDQKKKAEKDLQKKRDRQEKEERHRKTALENAARAVEEAEARKAVEKTRLEQEAREAAEKTRLEQEAREVARIEAERIEAQRIEAARIEAVDKTRLEQEARKKTNRGTILDFFSPIDITEKNITEEKQREEDEKLQTQEEKTNQLRIDQYFFSDKIRQKKAIQQLNKTLKKQENTTQQLNKKSQEQENEIQKLNGELQEQANEIRRLKAPKQTRHGKSLSV